MRLVKIMFSQDMRTKLFQCHIKDYMNKEEVRGVDENPMEAFRKAEDQLTENVWYVESRDPADWVREEDIDD